MEPLEFTSDESGAERAVSSNLFTAEAVESSPSFTKKGGDQYFTPKPISTLITHIILHYLERITTVGSLKGYRVFEPCAGDGRNLVKLQKAGLDTLGIDIEKPRTSSVVQLDFQKLVNETFGLYRVHERVVADVTIMNPPFALKWASDNDETGYQEMESRFLAPVWNHLIADKLSVHICNADSLDRIREHPLYAKHVAPDEVLVLRFPHQAIGSARVNLAVVFSQAHLNYSFERVHATITPEEVTITNDDLSRMGNDEILAWDNYRAFASDLFQKMPQINAWDINAREWAGSSMPMTNHSPLRDKGISFESIRLMASREKMKRSYWPYTLNIDQRGKLVVHWEPIRQVAVERHQRLNQVVKDLQQLAGQTLDWLLLRSDYWRSIQTYATNKWITIQPEIFEQMAERQGETTYLKAPFQDPRGLMSLANLIEHDRIKCVKSLAWEPEENYPAVQYEAGEWYPIQTFNAETHYERPVQDEQGRMVYEDGKPKIYTIRIELLRIKVGESNFYSHIHSKELLEHFEIPTCQTVLEMRPDLAAKYSGYIEQLEKDYPRLTENPGLRSLWEKQKQILLLSLMKGQSVIAVDPGGGKTLLTLCHSIIRWKYEQSIDKVMIFSPPNLMGGIGQSDKDKSGWMGELHWFFGMEFQKVITAKTASKDFKAFAQDDAPSGLYLASVTGSRSVVAHREERIDRGPYRKPEIIDHYEFASDGLQGEPMRRVLVAVDEATKIKGGQSDTLTSMAFQRINCPYKLLLTGTPGDNYAGDSFRLLHWATVPFGETGGVSDSRFAYPNTDQAWMSFRTRFHQVQSHHKRNDKTGKKQEVVRILPKMSNHINFWYLTRSIIIRATKQELREDMPGKETIKHWVPFGQDQFDGYEYWLNENNFVAWFCDTHVREDGSRFDDEFVRKNRKLMGQLQMLRGAINTPSTLPELASPMMTPKVRESLRLCLDVCQRGEKVVFLSDHREMATQMAELLSQAGVPVSLYLGGLTSAKKEKEQRRFKMAPGAAAFVGTLGSCAHGLNLQVAKEMVIAGLPWNYAYLVQGSDRIHRINIMESVKLHIVNVACSYDSVLWDLIEQKEKSAALAFDGEMADDEYYFDNGKMLKSCEEQAAILSQSAWEPVATTEASIRAMLDAYRSGTYGTQSTPEPVVPEPQPEIKEPEMMARTDLPKEDQPVVGVDSPDIFSEMAMMTLPHAIEAFQAIHESPVHEEPEMGSDETLLLNGEQEYELVLLEEEEEVDHSEVEYELVFFEEEEAA